ncbi:MAG: hypothetical protein HY673_16730 [Chloroflexi bacterium]|nr:hypothetical protein [Chloroflexota bacterium]
MDKAWKAAERHVARALGGQRTPLSGNNSKHTAGDVIHPSLYVEVKYRKRFAIVSLMKQVEKAARKEGKTPVLALQEAGAKKRYYLVEEAVFLDSLAQRQADHGEREIVGNGH